MLPEPPEEPLSQPPPPLEPLSHPPPEPLPEEPPPFLERPDQLPREADPFDNSEPLQLPPEDQPELPLRLDDIVQPPPPQLELPGVIPPLDHMEPPSMFQDQPPLRPLQDQRPEFQPIGQPCFIQYP